MRKSVSILIILLAGCGGKKDLLTEQQALDPESCKTCHPDHVAEWSRSMHAYAADDPVFLAMNARGQRETHGQLGNFCVQCHAPMALRTGATQDGLNLASLPQALKGVTCFFCHTADSVSDSHNAPIHLAGDRVMRGGIADPVENSAHKASYASLQDRNSPDSSKLCGSCHDIVGPLRAPIERTYKEWQGTLFSAANSNLNCGNCHMDGRDALAAQAPNVKLRKVHSHAFPAVDVSLTATPDDTARREVQAQLDSVLQAQLCVESLPAPRIHVVFDNVAAGHRWPSGATQDRRAWAEITAYKGGKEIFHSGRVGSSTVSVEKLADPSLWLLRDCMFGQDGQEVDMFWQAARIKSASFPGPLTNDRSSPLFYATHAARAFPDPAAAPNGLSDVPDRVTMKMHLQPIARAILDDLVRSGDLPGEVAARMPTFDLAGGTLEWTSASAQPALTDQRKMVTCVSNGLGPPVVTATTSPSLRTCR